MNDGGVTSPSITNGRELEQVSVKIRRDQLRAIDAVAAATELSRSSIIRIAIRLYFESRASKRAAGMATPNPKGSPDER